MARNCNCSGGCTPENRRDDGFTRREFLTLVGAGTAGLFFGAPALGQGISAETIPSTVSPEDLARWKQALREPALPRLYLSDKNTDARMHLGGIGTGNFEIGADGQLTTWQLFNTLRDGTVPFYFGARCGSTARLLQTAGGPDFPRVRQIEMKGEYPISGLRYLDPDLPVRIELTALTPFAPLDARFSSMPLAAFSFRVHNPTNERQSVSLAAFMQNPVGYDAEGPIRGVEHSRYGGNINEVMTSADAAVLAMSAQPGQPGKLGEPVAIYTNLNTRDLNPQPSDHPPALTAEGLDRIPAAGQLSNTPSPHHLIWLEDAPVDLAEAALSAARKAVDAGAVLIFSGHTMPLLQAYAQLTGGKPLDKASGRPNIVFEDFEGDYAKWTVEGTAFGDHPAHGTLPNQQEVSGFLGKGLVNSYLNGDDSTGRLISKPFTIERNFIRFLVGGGSHPTTQIRLIADGKTVRATSGRDEELLLPAVWDVRDFMGKTVHIEIVDDQKGGWGHINVDQIEFADLPGSLSVMQLLDEILPARFSSVEPDGPTRVTFGNLQPLPDSVPSTTDSGLQLLARKVGTGQVFLADGQILKPGEEGVSVARESAFRTLCALVGAHYVPATGTLPTSPGFGTLALAALDASRPDGAAPIASRHTALASYTDWKDAWDRFNSPDGLEAIPGAAVKTTPSPPGRTINGALATTVEVGPGESVDVPFLLAWHYPNKYNRAGVLMGNHYTTRWPDAQAVIRDAAASYPALRDRTDLFRRTFYDSTLPYWLLDCLTSQAATIRQIGVVFRIANGDIYGWEGSNGCCDPTCTHVWGYEQSLSRLFPDLEKEMRRIDYKHQQAADGGIHNRTAIPSPPQPSGEPPFTDGHASCILKAYREALNHPDDSWLKEYWPGIRRGVDYLVNRDAATSDGTPNGTLEDDQANTYDEALHGVSTFIGTYYLAALRAGEELARRMGDTATADRYHGVFEKGQKRLVDLCWNGEYYEQHLPGYDNRGGEIGPGCMADQLIGQWWAHQLGLGYLLPKDQVQTALRSIFKYNWLPDFTNWKHRQRWFAGGKDKGLLICTWPRGGRPARPMNYVDEVWTGIEYQVAGHMVYEGLIDPAFAIVKGARDRYDGIPRPPMQRSPWNEIECGGHYARAMSSWSLLLALSGWEYDGIAHSLRFTPRITPDDFKSFWSGSEGWGSLRQVRKGQAQTNEITIVEGKLTVEKLQLEPTAEQKQCKISVGNRVISAPAPTGTGGILTLRPDRPVTLQAGETLRIEMT